MMKKVKFSDLCLMLLIPIVNIVYAFINNGDRGCYSLVTSADTAVPFIKAFVIPYLMWYPFIGLCLVYFLKNEKEVYYRTLFALIASYITCYIIFFVFQTYVPRPTLQNNDILDKLMNIVYSSDKPFNCFPSIHVVSCYIVTLGVFDMKKSSNLSKIVVTLTAISIILSTQFIKQHVLMDVFSAILLGDALYKAIKVVNWEEIIWKKKSFLLLMMKKKLEI